MEPGDESISDNEFLYRRIPVSMNWVSGGVVSPQAFAPHKDRDVTGISVTRERLKGLPEASWGQPGKQYLLAKLRVGDVRAEGIKVVPKPWLSDGSYDLAHAELSDITAENRKEKNTLELQEILAGKLVLEVLGPFLTPHN